MIQELDGKSIYELGVEFKIQPVEQKGFNLASPMAEQQPFDPSNLLKHIAHSEEAGRKIQYSGF